MSEQPDREIDKSVKATALGGWGAVLLGIL